MYSKQEASLIRKKFWETAGQYFALMPSAGKEKVNWINYKTGVRFISFRMHVDDSRASIAVEIFHPDSVKRSRFFNQFVGLKKQLAGDWKWEEESVAGLSKISAELGQVNIYKTETWPEIISFLKERIITLDAFWEHFRDVFEMLD